jgi:cytochrome c oxidase subunit 3
VSTILLFLAGVAAVAGWWLSRHRLAAKPWLEESAVGDLPSTGASPLPTAKIGLAVFLTVVGALFSLSISAYFMRMHEATDWLRLPTPPILWLNTAVLAAGSIALEWARREAAAGQRASARDALVAAGASALAFLIGQGIAWRAMATSGIVIAGNPAASFFYLLTALHGLHILGGLVALARTIRRASGEDDTAFRLSVDLCTTYWHALLLVWLVLFGLLLAH